MIDSDGNQIYYDKSSKQCVFKTCCDIFFQTRLTKQTKTNKKGLNTFLLAVVQYPNTGILLVPVMPRVFSALQGESCTSPQWVRTLLSTCCSGTLSPARPILISSSRWLPPCGPPREQSALGGRFAWKLQGSGRCLAFAMFGQWFLEAASPKSTFSSLSCAIASEPKEVVQLAVMSFSPALMKVSGWRRLQWLMPLQMVSAIAFKTWLWCQR